MRINGTPVYGIEAEVERHYGRFGKSVVVQLCAARREGFPVLPADKNEVNRAFTQGLLLAAGVPVNEPIHPQAEIVAARGELFSIIQLWAETVGLDVSGISRIQLVKMAMRRRSRQFERNGLYRIALSGSSADFSTILADVLEKSIPARSMNYSATSDKWVNRVGADRLDLTRLMEDRAWDLPLIDAGSEFPHRLHTLPPDAPNVFIQKRGEILRVTESALLSDDLQVIDDMSRLYGGIDKMVRDDLVYTVLGGNANAADGNPLFSTAHGNTTTGTLSTASIGTALGKLAAQSTIGNASTPRTRMNLRGAFLIVPVALQATAGELVRNFSVDGARLELIVEARLDALNPAQWYIATNPNQQETLVLAELNAEPGLDISQKHDFDTDSINFRIRYFCAAQAVDWRGIVRSSGS